MIMTEKVKEYVDKLGTDPRFKNLVELIYQDLKKCKTDITNMVLQGRIDLSGAWSSYVNTDINVIYEEDMLKMNELLTMHGIRSRIPALMGDDIAVLVIYRFDKLDAYGGIMNTANVYHITIKGNENDNDVINEWFILYD